MEGADIMTVLKLDNVTKVFSNGPNDLQTVLSNISFEANKGEFLCIVGPSGCGKSTILRLIAGLIPVTKGKILLNGKEVHEPDTNRGMVFQSPTLFPWLTVRENIEYSLRIKKKKNPQEVNRLISLIGLEKASNMYPHQLSGGMAQRVSLARTMINSPEVFMLDEPLGALDAFTRMSMQDELLKLWRDKNNLMIMVTHDIDEAIYMGTRVLIMKPNPGEIKDIVDVDLEYPRDRTDLKFTELRRDIMKKLHWGKEKIEIK